MIVLYFISVLLAFAYIFIIVHIYTAWLEIEEWRLYPSFKPDTLVTVLIPFRNEKGNVGQCCSAILRNSYPRNLLEIIAIDDHSEDNSSAEIPKGVISLKNNGIGKKDALSTGVLAAKGQLIITTDADCISEPSWIRSMVSYYEYTGKRMIAGMVALDGRKRLLDYFQVMETCGLMALHGAGIHNQTHFLANGANLAFEKTLFEEFDPFSENEMASGDDVHFISMVAEDNPSTIGFLKSKDGVVTTEAERSWPDFWRQRKRWATKNRSFSKGIYKWMTGIIFFLNVSILVNLILAPFTAGFSLFAALTQILIKGIMDYLLLHNMCSYFEKQKTLKYFIPSLLFQTFYIVVMGTFALVGGRYNWKGRRVK